MIAADNDSDLTFNVVFWLMLFYFEQLLYFTFVLTEVEKLNK